MSKCGGCFWAVGIGIFMMAIGSIAILLGGCMDANPHLCQNEGLRRDPAPTDIAGFVLAVAGAALVAFSVA